MKRSNVKKVLIANRGEIAVRILRACKDLGIQTVAVHSTADAEAMHVRLADESVCIGPPQPRESYLNIPSIISAACVSGADAIHPGFGFLSENSTFSHMVEEHGLIFIGPKADHIAMMGDKIMAKKTFARLGLPTVPGSDGAVTNVNKALKMADEMGYPVLIKAAGGGGGRGMKVARSRSEFTEAYETARQEAGISFGNNQVYLEKYLTAPRHIEFQIIADQFGNAVHLGERDCSLQRRNQKVWEEAVSLVLTPKFRDVFGGKIAEAVGRLGYSGAGTLEFLYENGELYFIEMNTRIQVEHPITEVITGIDIVREQILIAGGNKLSLTQNDVTFKGHAIECRINAENSETFIPSAGTINNYHCPGGPGVRVDSALYDGCKVPPYYDSLISKLIVHANDREQCLARLRRALREYVIDGVDTLIPLHMRLANNPDIIAGNFDIHFLERLHENK
ncbi:MAG: acetyl-CoA carboxylase biotin carboxylase subunit [Holosporaceae bacterium]|jgi:acetyl-CoA carboxylase biotin carboxylase subunit|nr:acetyl-CoA carboxylase biotin carboxylase subunit [Holosporaceae bacterium]